MHHEVIHQHKAQEQAALEAVTHRAPHVVHLHLPMLDHRHHIHILEEVLHMLEVVLLHTHVAEVLLHTHVQNQLHEVAETTEVDRPLLTVQIPEGGSHEDVLQEAMTDEEDGKCQPLTRHNSSIKIPLK